MCVGCHASFPHELTGDYAVDSREALLKSGKSSHASIVPGKRAVPSRDLDGYEMLPKESDRLTKKQTEYVLRWIEPRAPWPEGANQQEIHDAELAVRENEDGEIADCSGGRNKPLSQSGGEGIQELVG